MGAATGLCPGNACPTCGTRPGTAGSLSSPCSLLAGNWSAGAPCFPRTNRPGRGPASRALWHAPGQVCPVLPPGCGEVHLQRAALHLDIRRVLVYPQAYAAVIPQSGQLLKTPRVFIVDIGGFTPMCCFSAMESRTCSSAAAWRAASSHG